jgi:potassium transporter
MSVDNDGEGGILALMSLLGVKRQHRPVIIAFGLFGAALIYGDGAITPAISAGGGVIPLPTRPASSSAVVSSRRANRPGHSEPDKALHLIRRYRVLLQPGYSRAVCSRSSSSHNAFLLLSHLKA